MTEERIRFTYVDDELANLLDVVVPFSCDVLRIRRPEVRFFESAIGAGDDVLDHDWYGFARYADRTVGVRLGLPVDITVHVLLHELAHLRQHDLGMRLSHDEEEKDACETAHRVQSVLWRSQRYFHFVGRVIESGYRPRIEISSCVNSLCPGFWGGYSHAS